MRSFRSFPLVAATLVALALGGCMAKRDSYETPEIALPETYRQAGKSGIPTPPESEARLPRDLSRWWTRFDSPELNRLVERALDNNWRVKAAVARLAQAEANLGQTRAGELPRLEGIADASVDAPEDGIGTVDSGESVTNEREYRLGLRASYEVDLWGANRAASVAAWERSKATMFARRTVAWTLTANVVDTYLRYLSLQDRVATARKTRQVFRDLLAAVEARLEGGEADGLQVAQQRAAVAEASSTIPDLERQRDQALHALAVLVGTTPGNLNLDGESLSGIAYPTVVPGLPSRLLLRRPDVQQAEHDLLAADADIDVARAAFLPQFNLTAEGGVGSNFIEVLFRPESLFFNIAGDVVQDIFDGGANEARLAASRARHRELVADYQQASLTALREVEDALSAIHFLKQRVAAQREAVAASRDSLSLNREAFEMGVIDHISLLDAQRTLFDNEDAFFSVALQRAQASVALFQALGGDTDRQATAGTPETGASETEPKPGS